MNSHFMAQRLCPASDGIRDKPWSKGWLSQLASGPRGLGASGPPLKSRWGMATDDGLVAQMKNTQAALKQKVLMMLRTLSGCL